MLKEPLFLDLPSKEDFYYDGDCDEKYALNNYYGKDINFILEECKSFMPLAIISTFEFVGTRATRYYLFGAFRYLQEAIETGDKKMIFESPDVLNSLTSIIDKHFSDNPKDMQCITNYMKEFFQWATNNYDAFEICENVYGNMKEKWKDIIKKIEDFEQ